jgi:nitroreductase
VAGVTTENRYQRRYLAHQARKRAELRALMVERHSSRVFADDPVPDEVVLELLSAATTAPSSCDRRAVSITVITERQDREILGGLLVGGVGWVHRAPTILLLHADAVAYKAPGELPYMPYLDAGVQVQALYLAATAAELACCFVNPAIRPRHKAFFAELFGADVFCGAMALGRPLKGG